MADSKLLADDDEVLFRQVHPAFVRDGRPSSQAFRPTPKDEGSLPSHAVLSRRRPAHFSITRDGAGFRRAARGALASASVARRGFPPARIR